MNILVLLKMVPDVVEELEIAPDAPALDLESLRMILSESDDHALEEALLLKERHGGRVTVLAVEAPEIDEALYSALAKGADSAVKIVAGDEPRSTAQSAAMLAAAIANDKDLLGADLILTGVQAIDDLDGLTAPVIAHRLARPYLGIVTGLSVDAAARAAVALKEYPGGVRGEFEVQLPAVLGIQAAEKPPRYVPVAKVRAAMKSQKIACAAPPTLADGGGPLVSVAAMKKPEPAGRAQMMEGAPDEVAGRLCEILSQGGVL